MEFTKISGGCENKNCPAVYQTDRGTFLVQGNTISDPEVLAGMSLAEGESAVEVPAELLKGIHVPAQ